MAESKKQEYAPDVVELVKRTVWMESRKLAVVVKAVYEKFGDEGIDAIRDAVREFGRQKGRYFREEAGLTPEECDVEIALSKVYPQAHKHFAPAGLDMERVKFTPEESETRVHSCSQLESWKEVWDKPWIMCEIFAAGQDEGFMEGVNPKLTWHKHVERNGAKGLARGKEYPCTIGLKLK